MNPKPENNNNTEKQKMKRDQESFVVARFLGAIGICVQVTGCALEDIENFSSAMNAMNHELGYSGATYGASSPVATASYDSSDHTRESSPAAQTTWDDGAPQSTTNPASEQKPASAVRDDAATAGKMAGSSKVHVYAIAYGKNACGMETALGYAHYVVDAGRAVSEKRRLETSLQSRYSGVSICRSSSSLYDFGKSAKAVMLITWQAGTEKCPTTVYSYAYGASIEDADAKGKQSFKRWAPKEATMHTVDLSRFAQ